MKTKSLTLIAGTIWLLAGFNVCRIGVVSWMDLETTSVLMVVGSIVTLLLFSTMFVKMLFKNVRRIRRIEVDKRRLWHMMPVKSYAIMAFMINSAYCSGTVPRYLPPSSRPSMSDWVRP